jgi:hypothetical protein
MKFWRQRKDEELDAEIRSHLDAAIRDRIARGETPEEARLNAQREFGNVGLVKEVTREMWGWASLERLMQDVIFVSYCASMSDGYSFDRRRWFPPFDTSPLSCFLFALVFTWRLRLPAGAPRRL